MVLTQKSGILKVSNGNALLRLAAAAAVLALLVALPGWAAPPTGYSEANIGPPPANGSTVVNTDGSWTVMGSGNQYDNNTADQLYFVYQTVTGDGSMIFRLQQQADANGGTGQYIGPMVRASTSPGAPFAGPIMATGAVNWIHRLKADDQPVRESGDSSKFTFPKWMMVQRVGNTVQGFESSDGRIWDVVKPAFDLGTNLGSSALFGLSFSSRGSNLGTAKVDNVQVIPGGILVPGLESAATNNLAFIAWQPVSTAAGYNIYRGPAGATIDKMTLIATLNQGTDPFFLDWTPSTTPLRNMSYVVAGIFKDSAGKLVEGPAARAR